MHINKQSMSGKVCLVTGTANSIGEATLYMPAPQGETVVDIE